MCCEENSSGVEANPVSTSSGAFLNLSQEDRRKLFGPRDYRRPIDVNRPTGSMVSPFLRIRWDCYNAAAAGPALAGSGRSILG